MLFFVYLNEHCVHYYTPTVLIVSPSQLLCLALPRQVLRLRWRTLIELAHQITNSGAGLVFVHPALLDTLLKTFTLLRVSDTEVQKRVVIMSYTSIEKAMEKQLNIGPQWARFETFLKQGKLDREEMFSGDQVHDSIMLCYSSGTTGLSKGVEVRVSLVLMEQLHPLTHA